MSGRFGVVAGFKTIPERGSWLGMKQPNQVDKLPRYMLVERYPLVRFDRAPQDVLVVPYTNRTTDVHGELLCTVKQVREVGMARRVLILNSYR